VQTGKVAAGVWTKRDRLGVFNTCTHCREVPTSARKQTVTDRQSSLAASSLQRSDLGRPRGSLVKLGSV
jgi:hypothetical protein